MTTASETTTLPVEKEILMKLIEKYGEMPYLYNKTDNNYFNKSLRDKGYMVLLEIYKDYDKNATIKTLKKKIDNLKTTYLRELKKVKASKQSGAGTDDIYVPSLWYFDAFHFLVPSAAPCRQPEDSLIHEVPIETDAAPYCQQNKRKFVPINQTDVAADTLRANAETLSEFDIAGLNVARKLAKMDPLQAIYAESLINNVLKQGLLNKLKEDTDLCDNQCNRKTLSRACENQTANSSIFQFSSVPSTEMYQEEEIEDKKPIIIS